MWSWSSWAGSSHSRYLFRACKEKSEGLQMWKALWIKTLYSGWPYGEALRRSSDGIQEKRASRSEVILFPADQSMSYCSFDFLVAFHVNKKSYQCDCKNTSFSLFHLFGFLLSIIFKIMFPRIPSVDGRAVWGSTHWCPPVRTTLRVVRGFVVGCLWCSLFSGGGECCWCKVHYQLLLVKTREIQPLA